MPFINTGAIVIAVTVLLGLVVFGIGFMIIVSSRKTKMAQHGQTSGVILIGVAIMGLGLLFMSGGTILYSFKDAISSFLTLK